MAAAAAILIRKEKDIVELYRRASATSVATARTPDDLGIHHRVPFKVLVRRAVLRDAGGDRFYLDEARWQALQVRRRRMAVGVLVLMIAMIFVLSAAGIITVGFGIPRLH